MQVIGVSGHLPFPRQLVTIHVRSTPQLSFNPGLQVTLTYVSTDAAVVFKVALVTKSSNGGHTTPVLMTQYADRMMS